MTLTPEQALTIARFCWPDGEWATAHPGREPYAQRSDGQCFTESSMDGCVHCGDWLCVADAERALVERGLGEEYGRALSIELGIRWPLTMDVGNSEARLRVAMIRTATPEVIARAILRVIEGQEQK